MESSPSVNPEPTKTISRRPEKRSRERPSLATALGNLVNAREHRANRLKRLREALRAPAENLFEAKEELRKALDEGRVRGVLDMANILEQKEMDNLFSVALELFAGGGKTDDDSGWYTPSDNEVQGHAAMLVGKLAGKISEEAMNRAEGREEWIMRGARHRPEAVELCADVLVAMYKALDEEGREVFLDRVQNAQYNGETEAEVVREFAVRVEPARESRHPELESRI